MRCYYYGARLEQTRDPSRFKGQQSFFDKLETISRFELRLGQLRYPPNYPSAPSYEKGVDIKLATDMLIHAFRGTYDVAILVSNDTDFVDAVQGVKDAGKNVEVVLFDPNPRISAALRQVADEVIHANAAFLEGCWRQ